jgi:hypothetical protein
LFTHGFYQALLTNGEFGFAAAQGRRTGIRHGSDPRNSVDWAFPALFIAEGIKIPRLPVSEHKEQIAWHKAAKIYAPDYPPCCDRLEVFKYLTTLMAEPAAQRTIARRESEFQVLAVVVKARDDPNETAPRFGRTWLLRAMAAEAARAGHLPCLLINSRNFGGPDSKKWPKKLPEFLSLLKSGLNFTARTLVSPRHRGDG